MGRISTKLGPSSQGWTVAWGLASVAFGGASLVVPLYVVALGGDAFTLGVLAGVAAIAGVPGSLTFGRIADRTGERRRLVLGALALVTVTLVLIPLVETVALVVLANGLFWFAFAAATPVLTLLAVGGAPESEWSERIAERNTYQGVGWAAGLLLGVLWTALVPRVLGPTATLRGLLLCLAACGGLGLATGAVTFPADPPVAAQVSGLRIRRALRGVDRFGVRAATLPFTLGRTDLRGIDPREFVARFTPALALYFGAVLLFFAGFGAYFAPLPAFLADVGFDAGQIFALYLVSAVGTALCFVPAGRAAARYDLGRLHAAGLVVRALALPIVAIAGAALGASALGLGVAGVLFAAVGITWAPIAVTAGTLVTRLAPIGVRGEALGVYAAVGALAGGIGSVAGGWIARTSYLLAFAFAAALVVASATVVLAVQRGTTPAETPAGSTPGAHGSPGQSE